MSSVTNAWQLIAKQFRNSTRGRQHLPSAVVGVAHDMGNLLAIVNDPQQAASERVAAANLIRSSLENNAVSSIQEIWYSIKNLIDSANQAEVRRAGWRLMRTCVNHDEINVGAFNTYYHTLIDCSNIEDFDLVLQVLQDLTNNGKRIILGQTAQYRLPTVLLSWVQLLALRSREIRSHPSNGDIAAQWGTTTPENFESLLAFLINVLKFGMTLFEEKDLSDIVLSACAIIRTTSSLAEIEMCCNVIDTVMAFGIAPLPSLRPVLEALCGINLVVESLEDQTWRTVQNLCRSHLAHSTVTTLCGILQPKSDASPTMRQGAVRMLARVVVWLSQESPDKDTSVSPTLGPSSVTAAASASRPMMNPAAAQAAARLIEEGSGMKDVPLSQVLESFSTALESNIISLNIVLEISIALSQLLEARSLPFDYDLWQSPTKSPLRLVYQITEYLSKSERGDFAKVGWVSADARVSDSPETSAAASEDLKASLTRVFSAIAALLSERDSMLPLEEVCLVCVELARYLDEASTIQVLDVCKQIHLCSPYMSSWQDHMNLILTRIYRPQNCSTAVRLKVLDLLRDAYMWAMAGESTAELAQASAAGTRGPAVEAMLTVSLEDFLPVTDRVFSVLSTADEALSIELLGMLERIALSSLHFVFDRVIDIIMGFVPDQSARRVTTDKESAHLGLITRSIARVFASTYQFRAREARKAYVALVQICRRSHFDPGPFQQAFAILSRIRAGVGSYIVLTNPSIEPDYGVLAQQQVPVDYVTEWDVPSSVLKRSAPYFADELSSVVTLPTNESFHNSLDSSSLLNVVVDLLQRGGCPEAYAQVLINLPLMLTNMQLFMNVTGDLINVRNLFLTLLTPNGKLPVPPVVSSVTRQDYIAIIVHALTILVSYDEIFQKADYDKLVQTLTLYMSRSWDNAAKWAIHCLVLCCYECPQSVQRYLPQLLNKFQTKLSSREASTHILEFILTVSLVEELTGNFNFQEYKRVFGMCFTYIQDANYHLRNQKGDADVESQVLSQYLLRLAFFSITTLFLSIELSQRRSHVPYLVRNLVLADGETETMSPLSMVTYDMVRRYAYSNLPLTLYSAAASSQNTSATQDRRRWLVNSTVYEYCTDVLTGQARIIVRRPVGTLVLNFRPELKAAISSGEPNGELYTANFWFLSLYSLKHQSNLNPLPIPDDSQFTRAVSTLDRAPVLDLYKAGVIYIGPRQRTEEEVLSNTSGSPAYNRFLRKLGRLIRLQGNRSFYVGGLDTEMDLDGKYAYGHQTKISQLILHVTTMMPNREDDWQRSSKKRHIGNNFVNIYFDESGCDFDFELVKSQFNFINIVITPTYSDGKWRVRAYRKEGLANVLSAYEIKTMSEQYLSQFVRHLVIKASQYATVYNQHGEYTDNWTYRLQLINSLRQRLEALPKEVVEDDTVSMNSNGPGERPDEDHSREIKMLEWLDVSKFTI